MTDAERPPGAPPAAVPQLVVVDDDPGVRLVLGRALARFGYEVFLAEGGAEALAHLDNQPDIVAVLTDIDMSPVSGIELTRHILSRRPGLPILYITGNPTAAADLAPGRVDVLTKPVDIARLGEAVDSLVRRTRGTAHEAAGPGYAADSGPGRTG